MIFTETRIPGVYLIDQEPRRDERGFFARQWCADELARAGLDVRIAQINTTHSAAAGTLRGVHYQKAPHAEVKLVRCTRGAVFDVAVDLRPGSPTFCQWFGTELDPESGRMLYIPEGCGHGFLTLAPDTDLAYQASAPYAPGSAAGVRHDDPAFNIVWPGPINVISAQDRNWPFFRLTLGLAHDDDASTGTGDGSQRLPRQPLPGAARRARLRCDRAPPRAHPVNVPGVRWVRGDVMDRAHMRGLLDGYRPHGLLHLAWFVEQGRLIADPSNLAWTAASLDLIRAFREAGGERCVVSGSCYEYDWRYGYCVEDVTPCEPDTLYGAAKDALRRAFMAYCNVSGLSGAWGRAFFMYGPRENPGRLVSSVILSLLRGQQAKTSHGLQVRDYLHIQDVADGMVALLASQARGAYNIAAGSAVTVRDIVELLGKITGRSDLLQIGALPARANDAPLVLGDTRRTANEIGWKPKLALEAGLSATVDWWRTHLQASGG